LAVTDTTAAPWMTVGTEDGYIALWDLRFNVMSKLWRHSSHSTIHKISIPSSPFPEAKSVDTPVIITSAGDNEVSVWDVLQSRCLHVFRTLSVSTKVDDVMVTPSLAEMSLGLAQRSSWAKDGGYRNFLSQHQINVDKRASVVLRKFSPYTGSGDESLKRKYNKSRMDYDFVSSFIWTGFGLPGILDQTKNLLLTTGTDGFIRSWDVAEDNASETFQRPCDITYTDLYEESGKDEINTRIHLSQTVPTRPSHFIQQTSKTQITDEDIRGKRNIDMKFISRNGHYLLVGDDAGSIKVWKY
jgi:WD40 repeat protein